MTMASNFDAILGKKPEDIHPPLVLPVGSYLAVINGQFVLGESSAKKTPQVDFPSKIIQPMNDVDQTALSAVVGGVQGKELRGRMSTRFYLTEDALFMVDEFLTNVLGIEKEGRTLKERFSEALGKQFVVTVRHNTTSNPGQEARVFAEPAGYAKA